MSGPVRWSDAADDVIKGDITAAVAYVTPAGGAAVTAVAPCGIGQRDLGTLGFTTSLGFGKKLERIIRNPHVALAITPVSTGTRPALCSCWLRAWPRWSSHRRATRLEALTSQAERYVGKVMRGPAWDRLLREYYQERVFVDIALERVAAGRT